MTVTPPTTGKGGMISRARTTRPQTRHSGQGSPDQRRQTTRRRGGSIPDSLLSRRRHARFIVSLPVRLTPVASTKTKGWRGRSLNIGGGGLAVELTTRLAPGTHVMLEVRTGIGPIRMETDVIWTRRLPGKAQLFQHGLSLAERAEVLDLPIGVLLGEWLRGLAKRTAKAPGSRAARHSGTQASR